MVVRSFAVGVAVALGLAHDPGCGGVDNPPSGPNAPCTRTRDCTSGLACLRGVCIDPDGGSASDAGTDAAPDGSD